MFAHLRAIGVLLFVTLLVCSIAYPLLLLALAQGLFAGSANGSLIEHEGRTIGSRLIAQPCKGDEWFWPRPSAVNYNAAASGGSNLSASNPALRERVEAHLRQHWADSQAIPSDAVLASGSGLDPHITLSNARLQAPRVARTWAAKVDRPVADIRTTLDQLLEENAFRPLWGLAGQERLVNVLELNRELLLRLER